MTRLWLQLVFWLAVCLAGIVAMGLIGGDWTVPMALLFAFGLMAVARALMRRRHHE